MHVPFHDSNIIREKYSCFDFTTGGFIFKVLNIEIRQNTNDFHSKMESYSNFKSKRELI